MLQVIEPVKTEPAPRQAAADQAHIGLLIMRRREVDPRLHQQRIGEGTLAMFDHGQAVVEVVEQQPVHRRQAVDRIQLEGGHRQFGQYRGCRQRCQCGAHGRIEAGVERGGLAIAQRRMGVVMQLTQLRQLSGIVDTAGGIKGHRGKRRHFLQRNKLRRCDQRAAVVQGHYFALELETKTLVPGRCRRVLKHDSGGLPLEPGHPLRVQCQGGSRLARAVALPDSTHGGAEVVGETLAVAHRRAHQYLAQVAADARQAVQVVGQFNDALLVVRPTVRHQLRQTGVDQVGGRVAPGKGRPGEGDHRHAHQQGFAGRQAAGIRPRVQRDVDAVVGFQQGLVPHRPFDQHPLPGDTVGSHDAVYMGAQLVIAKGSALEQQARIRCGPQQFGPAPEQHIVDLARVVEAAKGDKAVCQRGQGLDVRRVGRRVVANVVVGQADELFGVERVFPLR